MAGQMITSRSKWLPPNWLTRSALLRMVFLVFISCQSGDLGIFEPPTVSIGDAIAYGIWNPTGTDTCTKAIHDSYSTVGPDGIRYPTWHPAVDPTSGCTFGHEHGRDPHGSDLYGVVGDIPFAYANQHLAESSLGVPRNEDHVGHKIEWENDMLMQVGEGGAAAINVRCDVLVKMHQGTHSRDAFTNNMHEVAYHIRCSDGTGFSATLLTPIGTAGSLVASCDRERGIFVGTPTPPTSPSGGGHRAIPDVACVQRHILEGGAHFDSGLHESWEINVNLQAVGGRTLVSFNPYFQVEDPSRYYDPNATNVTGRPVELCKMPSLQGRDRCRGLPSEGVSWDDPRSPFKGVRRFVDVNGNNVRNEGGPTVWYTDALGRNGRTEPFTGAIRQWISSHSNEGLDLHGAEMGRDRTYNAPGVRAPN